MSAVKKIVFTNTSGQILTINGKLPVEAPFATITSTLDVYNTRAKCWFTLVISYKRTGNFPKGAVFSKGIEDISQLLKD